MVGYRVNLHESVAFIFTTNKHTENETVDIPLFTIASKKGTPFFELLVRAFQEMPETYSLLQLLFVIPRGITLCISETGPRSP